MISNFMLQTDLGIRMTEKSEIFNSQSAML